MALNPNQTNLLNTWSKSNRTPGITKPTNRVLQAGNQTHVSNYMAPRNSGGGFVNEGDPAVSKPPTPAAQPITPPLAPNVPSTPSVPVTPSVPGNGGVVNTGTPNSTVPSTPPVAPSPPSQTAPANPFQYNYNYMDFNTAKGQAEQKYNPLYEQAVKNIQAQQYQNEMDSGEIAANRGIAQSGLSADALNKIKIASQGQIADANTQRMSQVADLAQQMMQQDQQRGDSLYQRAYQQYRDSIGDQHYTDETTYNHGRDAVGDQRYTDETAYNHGRDTANDAWRQGQFDYQKGRDNIGDQRYTDETAYSHGRDAIGDQRYNSETAYSHGRDAVGDQRYNSETAYSHGRDAIGDKRYTDETKYNQGQDAIANSWKQKEWSQMSPAEQQKAMLDLRNSQALVNTRAAAKSTGNGSKGSKGGNSGAKGKGSSGKPQAALPNTPSANRFASTYNFYQKVLSNGAKGKTSDKVFRGPTMMSN